MIGFNYKKAVQTLNFFALKEGGEINKMKALKLIWFADRDHLRRYGRPILSDKYYAMRLGPVPSATKDLTKEHDPFLEGQELLYRDEFISPAGNDLTLLSIKEVDTDVFSQTDLTILERVYKEFGQYEQFELAELSHNYPEWEQFRKAIEAKQGTRFEMNYLEFFKNPKEVKEDYFSIDSEDLELSRLMFQENQEMMTCI